MRLSRFLVFFTMFAIGCGAYWFSRSPVREASPTPVNQSAPETEVATTPAPIREIAGDAEFDVEKNRKLPFDMVETGNGFHGDEIVARNGEKWLGLFPDEEGVYSLRSVKLDVTRAKDEIVDDDGEMSGKNVQTKEKSIPVFLLRGADSLKPGEVGHLFGAGDLTVGEEGRDYVALKNGFNRNFDAGAGNVELKVVRGLVEGKESTAVVLERAGVSQTIYVYPFSGDTESVGTLYWAGDVDRDGWPDFYMSLYYHDNVHDKMLFLSSRARQNKIVSLVASFRITGC